MAREIVTITDTDAYHALIADATEQNRVVVIKFYASWCRACKAMAPKIDTISGEWPQVELSNRTALNWTRPTGPGSGLGGVVSPDPHADQVEFYEIMFDNNKKLCKSLAAWSNAELASA